MCLICKGFEQGDCTECKPNASGNPCLCDEGYGLDRSNSNCIECGHSNSTEVIDNKCYCADGYFNTDSTGIDCQKCSLECSLLDLDTVSCDAEHSLRVSSGDCACEDGYFLEKDTPECLRCYPTCETCSGPEHNNCLSCERTYLHNDGTCGPCSERSYFENGECLECIDLCLTCVNQQECLECVENASLEESNRTCSCNEGFKQNTTFCEIDYFYYSITVEEDNDLFLRFTSPLEKNLTASDISIKLVNTSITYEYFMEKQTPSKYFITFKFETHVKQGEVFYLELIEESSLRSFSDQYLYSQEFQGKLNEYSPAWKEFQQGANAGEATGTVILTTGMTTGIINPDPAALWSTLNTIQILSLVPLTSIPLSPRLSGFFTGLSRTSFIPNFAEYLVDKNITNKHKRSYDYGIRSKVFLYNVGKPFSVLVSFLVFLPFIWALTKIRNRKFYKKVSLLLNHYKYGLITRFWIEGCLEITIACAVQLYGLPELSVTDIVNFGVAALFGLAMLVSPILIVRFVLRHLREIKLLSEKSAFYKTWGSLFYEFKHNGNALAKYYYSIFIAKRVLLVANLMFLFSYPILQLGINIFLMLGFSIFMVVVKPYSDFVLQLTITFAEFGISLIFSGTSYFLFDDRSFLQEVEDAFVYLVMIIIGVQTLGSVLIFFRNLVKVIKTTTAKRIKNNTDLSNQTTPNIPVIEEVSRPDPQLFFRRRREEMPFSQPIDEVDEEEEESKRSART